MKNAQGFLILIMGLFLLSGCATDEQARQKANIHLRLGYQSLQNGDSTSALRELLQAEKLNPKDPEIRFALGWAYSAKGRYLEALEQYQHTLVLDPKFTEAHNAIGAVYLEMGKWDEAIQEFEKVLKDILYPTPFYVLNNMGWAYFKKGDRSRAIEYFKKSIGLKRDFGLAYYNMGLAFKELKQVEEATTAFENVLTYAPNFFDAHFQLGLLYFDAGKHERAAKHFEEVIRLAPLTENARLSKQYLELIKKASP